MKYHKVEVIVKFPRNYNPHAWLLNLHSDAEFTFASDFNHNAELIKHLKSIDIELNKMVKLTDFLPASGLWPEIIISRKAKLIFEQFNICFHYFIPVRVKHKGGYEDYYWLKLIETDNKILDNVDYSNSTFVKSVYYNNHVYKNKEEFLTDFYSRPRKVILKKHDIDIFNYIHFTIGDIIISERVKEALIKEGVSGLEFEEIDWLE